VGLDLHDHALPADLTLLMIQPIAIQVQVPSLLQELL
jgi:hypothetical protein